MIEQFQRRIASPDRGSRKSALAELGDFLDMGDWAAQEIVPILDQLVVLAGSESDEEMRELALHGLLIAMSRGRGARVHLDPLVELLDSLRSSLVEYVLSILALSHDRRFEPVIRGRLADPSEIIRQAAEEALVEIRGRVS